MAKGKPTFFSNGLAIFSMFFGAGNVVFPLIIGQTIQGGLLYAILGLFVTAVIIPFSGLIAITLADGDYYRFFRPIGKMPGMLIIVFLLALIGPLAGIPRCITLTCSTMQVYFPGLTLPTFSFLSCLLIFILNFKRSKLISLIGVIFTPVMLFFMGFIIAKGILHPRAIDDVTGFSGSPFMYGLQEGYNTMDLIGAIFFATLVSRQVKIAAGSEKPGAVLMSMLKSCIIGAIFLSSLYVGFCMIASKYALELQHVPPGQLLGCLGGIILGKEAGLFVSMSVALACLTTAMALTAVVSDFIDHKIFKKKFPHWVSLASVLSATWGISLLDFGGIIALIAPILNYIYPLLCVYSAFYIVFTLRRRSQVATTTVAA